MNTVDLILLRLFLIGFLTTIVLGLYMLCRKVVPRTIGPLMRRLIWVCMLIISVLIFLVPLHIELPQYFPDWIYELRLPDPAKQVFDESFAATFFAGDRSEIQFEISKNFLSQLIVEKMTELDIFPDQNWQDKLIKLLPILRGFYLGGFVLSLLFLLINRRRQKKKQLDCQTLSQTGREAWQCELNSLRDRLNYYRQADVLMSETPKDRPEDIYNNWKKHQIPVPADMPESIETGERRQWLALFLDQIAKPDLLIFVLWMIIRSVFWFNPFWSWGSRTMIEDFQQARIHRLRKSIDQPADQHFFRSGILSWSFFLIIVIATTVFTVWQMPMSVTPSFDESQAIDTSSFQVERIVVEESFETFRFLADQDVLIPYIDDTGYESLMRVDNNGQNLWHLTLYQISGTPVHHDTTLLDARKTDSDRWTVAIRNDSRAENIHQIWLVELNGRGDVYKRRSIELPVKFGRIDMDYNIELIISTDGGWIWKITNLTTDQIGSTSEIELRRSDNILDIAKFDHSGQLVWHMASNAPKIDQARAISIQDKAYSYRMIQQVVPDQSIGCYLIFYDSTRLNRIDRSGRSQSIEYLNPISMLKIDDQGSISWQADMDSPLTSFLAAEAICMPDESLVIFGYDFEQNLAIINNSNSDLSDLTERRPSVYKISPQGEILWHQQYSEFKSGFWTDILLTGDSISAMLRKVDRESPVKSYYIQLNPDGSSRYLPLILSDTGYVNLVIVRSDGLKAYIFDR